MYRRWSPSVRSQAKTRLEEGWKEMENKALSLLPQVSVCHLKNVVSAWDFVRVAQPTLFTIPFASSGLESQVGLWMRVGAAGLREPLKKRNMLMDALLMCPLLSVGSPTGQLRSPSQ